MENVAKISPQPWPVFGYNDGLRIICKQFKIVAAIYTNYGTAICVGNTWKEFSDDCERAEQYCKQMNYIIYRQYIIQNK